MRVLQAVASLEESYGGPAFSVPSLAGALSQVGVENWFLSTRAAERASTNYLMEPMKARWIEAARSEILNTAYYSSETAKLAKATLQKNDIQLVHLHSIWNHLSWTVAGVAQSLNIPVVISPRSELMRQSLQRSRLKKTIAQTLFVGKMLRNCAGFHVTDASERDQLPKNYSSNVVLSPNGIDLSIADDLPEKSTAKVNLGLDPGRRYILFLSRLHERKNPDLLIRAFFNLGLHEKGWGLIMAGPADDPATNIKIEESLQDRPRSDVHFTGHVGYEAKRNCYAAADIFVLPTEFENFGNAIAEALACRLPVITTTGTPWGQLPGLNAGWIVDPSTENVEVALNEACEKSLPELGLIGASGRRVVSEFSWNSAAVALRSFYEHTAEITNS